VLTDVVGGGFNLQFGPGSACPLITPTFTTTGQNATSGMRIFIPAGSVGCISAASGQPAWMGFIPY
jgi:hypothetical protein